MSSVRVSKASSVNWPSLSSVMTPWLRSAQSTGKAAATLLRVVLLVIK